MGVRAGRLLYFFQPSGRMEDVFRALGRIDGAPTPEVDARIFAERDMRVVGPPLALTDRPTGRAEGR